MAKCPDGKWWSSRRGKCMVDDIFREMAGDQLTGEMNMLDSDLEEYMEVRGFGKPTKELRKNDGKFNFTSEDVDDLAEVIWSENKKHDFLSGDNERTAYANDTVHEALMDIMNDILFDTEEKRRK